VDGDKEHIDGEYLGFYRLVKDNLYKLSLPSYGDTSKKKVFIVGSERSLLSVFESTLIQETLNQTLVKQPTSRSSPPRRLRPDNRRGDFDGN